MPQDSRVHAIITILKGLYPDAQCSLDYQKDYELLFSTRLAAQCTDKRVNMVAQTLYADYPTLEAFANAELSELEQAVRPCGFYHVKARDLMLSAQRLLSEFGGKVPGTMEELLTLPGVGRKTANIILGDVYGQPVIVTDTHCIRLSNRLGLCKTKDPYKVELALQKRIPAAEQTAFCHRLVYFGRDVCSARAPKCAACPLFPHCPTKGAF